MTKAELETLMAKYGLDPSLYGQGKAKTVIHLLQEVNGGEAELVVEQGRLVRLTSVAKGEVLHISSASGCTVRLVEDRQVFTDGRVRERRGIVGISALSEKLSVSEEPTAGILRALREELGVDPAHASVEELGPETEEVESPSYPGLVTRYVLHRYRVTLGPEAYRPEGYVEVQPDKSTYFVWEVVA